MQQRKADLTAAYWSGSPCLLRSLSQSSARYVLRFRPESGTMYFNMLQVPFDYFCPSVKSDLKKLMCQHCDLYFPSQAARKRHEGWCRQEALLSPDQACPDDDADGGSQAVEVDGVADSGGLPILRLPQHQIRRHLRNR